MRNKVDIGYDDEQSQDDIAYCHDWYQHRADLSDALNAAKNDEQGHGCQCCANPCWRPAKGLLHGSTDGVGLYGVVRQSELQRDENGKQYSHPALFQAFLDVVGRSTDKRVLVLLLIQLGKGRLYECCGRTYECDEPHPEHGSRAANGDGCSYTCQIACAHTGGYTNGKGLERRNVAFLACGSVILYLVAYGVYSRLCKQAYHLAYHAELHKSRAPRKP